VDGLTLRTALNGAEVELLSFHEASGRWCVRDVQSGEAVRIKPGNLTRIAMPTHAVLCQESQAAMASFDSGEAVLFCLPDGTQGTREHPKVKRYMHDLKRMHDSHGFSPIFSSSDELIMPLLLAKSSKVVQYLCANCNSTGGGRLQFCAKCGVAHFCSKNCLAAFWPTHQPVCKVVRKTHGGSPSDYRRAAKRISRALRVFGRFGVTCDTLFEFQVSRLTAACAALHAAQHGDNMLGAHLWGSSGDLMPLTYEDFLCRKAASEERRARGEDEWSELLEESHTARCPECGLAATAWLTYPSEIYVREYIVTGLCPSCQDKAFAYFACNEEERLQNFSDASAPPAEYILPVFFFPNRQRDRLQDAGIRPSHGWIDAGDQVRIQYREVWRTLTPIFDTDESDAGDSLPLLATGETFRVQSIQANTVVIASTFHPDQPLHVSRDSLVVAGREYLLRSAQHETVDMFRGMPYANDPLCISLRDLLATPQVARVLWVCRAKKLSIDSLTFSETGAEYVQLCAQHQAEIFAVIRKVGETGCGIPAWVSMFMARGSGSNRLSWSQGPGRGIAR